MKKTILAILSLCLVFTIAACKAPDAQNKELSMEQAQVKEKVKGWGLYTNPQFRYELRHPKSWDLYLSDEGGTEVVFYPVDKTLSDEYHGVMKITGFVNWRTQYTLEQYYQNQANNLFEQGFEHETIDLGGFRGTWFKNVDVIYPNKKIDVIGFEANDRIVEIYILEWDEAARIAFNSFYFYGNKSLSDIQVPPAEDASADSSELRGIE